MNGTVSSGGPWWVGREGQGSGRQWLLGDSGHRNVPGSQKRQPPHALSPHLSYMPQSSKGTGVRVGAGGCSDTAGTGVALDQEKGARLPPRFLQLQLARSTCSKSRLPLEGRYAGEEVKAAWGHLQSKTIKREGYA